MAKNYRNYGRKITKRKSRYTETEKLAFQMGLVKRGLKNENSLISDSYNRGLNSKKKQPKEKKTLFGD